MPVMSKVEAAFCRSGPWRGFTAKVVMPWVLRGGISSEMSWRSAPAPARTPRCSPPPNREPRSLRPTSTRRWSLLLAPGLLDSAGASRFNRPTPPGCHSTTTASTRALHLVDRSPHRLIDSDALRQALTRAGFVEVTVATGIGRLVARFDATMPTRTHEA